MARQPSDRKVRASLKRLQKPEYVAGLIDENMDELLRLEAWWREFFKDRPPVVSRTPPQKD